MTDVLGVDVSAYQPNTPAFAQQCIAWGAGFAWIKVSEGRGYTNPKAGAQYDAFSAVPRGPYHFYDFSASPQENAANFVAQIKARTWELPPVLDVEQGGTNPGANAAALLACAQLVEQAGRAPLIYTYAAWWNANVSPDPAFQHYQLWIAQYPRGDLTPPDQLPQPNLAHPWGSWAVWQWSSAGNLDRDVMSAATLAALCANRQGELTVAQIDDLIARIDKLQATVSAVQAGQLIDIAHDQAQDTQVGLSVAQRTERIHAWVRAIAAKVGATGADADKQLAQLRGK